MALPRLASSSLGVVRVSQEGTHPYTPPRFLWGENRVVLGMVEAMAGTAGAVKSERRQRQVPYLPDDNKGAGAGAGARANHDHMLGLDMDPARALARRVVLACLATVSRTFMFACNTTVVHNAAALEAALKEHAESKRGIVTVCNHVASLDDPLAVAAAMPRRYLFDAPGLRYTLCATDRCFSKGAALSEFFRLVKVLPVERGLGLAQPGMAAAETALRRGGWVHVFPEGTRSRDGALQPARRGVAKLALAMNENGELPQVVPFAHAGMQDVIPIGEVVPRPGNVIVIEVGAPIDFADLADLPPADALRIATERVDARLSALKAQADARRAGLASPRPAPS